jgi:hypothetical protein
MSDDLEYRITKLQLRPGDFLVLKSRQPLTDEHVRLLRRAFEEIVGRDHRVIVIDDDLDLSILTKEEADKCA